jgi:hypothetical protein
VNNPKFRRAYEEHARTAHLLGMRAKEQVFRAQDAIEHWQPGRDRLVVSQARAKAARALAAARTALEAFDRALLEVATDDNERCTCGAWRDAKPHAHACPLFDPSDKEPRR